MKNILIAGGTDGLGLEIVRLLNQDDTNHVFVLGRNSLKLTPFKKSINFFDVDITKENEVESFAQSFLKTIDTLIISVGIFGHGELENFTYKQIRMSLETNLLGHIFLTRALLSKLKIGSRIVSINSISGLNTTRERSLLCSAKWGLRGFYNSLSEELKERKIMITQVFPGFFDSNYMEKVGISKDKSKAIPKEVLAKQVVDLCALPSEIYLPEIQIKNISYT